MHHVFGHQLPAWHLRPAHWLLAPVGVSVSLSMLGVWVVPDFVLMGPQILPPGTVVTATGPLPSAPADGSVTPVPSAESVRFPEAEPAAETVPTF